MRDVVLAQGLGQLWAKHGKTTHRKSKTRLLSGFIGFPFQLLAMVLARLRILIHQSYIQTPITTGQGIAKAFPQQESKARGSKGSADRVRAGSQRREHHSAKNSTVQRAMKSIVKGTGKERVEISYEFGVLQVALTICRVGRLPYPFQHLVFGVFRP